MESRTEKMSLPLLIAALGMGCVTLIHIVAGGADVYVPLMEAVPNAEMGLYVTLLWHFVSLFLAFGAMVFGLAAIDLQRWRSAVWATAILTLGMGILFFAFGLSHLGTPMIAPQWILVAPIVGLALWPLRRRPQDWHPA